ncbi:MAG TPA: alpha/beta fold hydrolase [Gemmatimonadales bacterium]|nr:alpha/beta fold hydrolase [Gemmatimonadales bacterium]
MNAQIVRAAAAALALLTGLPVPARAQSPSFPTLAADAPAGSGIAEPCTIQGLEGTARCGVFRVRESRDSAGGRTLDIAFVVLNALTPERRASDAVILLPGGPGEELIAGAVPISLGFAEVRRQRDVMVVDVRGVGRSSRLACAVAYPGGLPSRFGTLFPLDHAQACRDSLSRRAKLDAYTTASSVDDLDELRRWLGYSAVNLVGGSYGTRVAQVYLRRHPASVRTMVLNGVASLAEPLYVQHAFLLQRALDRLVAECRADSLCRADYPDLEDRLGRLLARFRRGPVELTIQGVPVSFGMGDLAYALRGLLYARGAELPRLIHEAADGAILPLAEYYLERIAWAGSANDQAGYHFSVLCAEDIAPLTDEDVARRTRGTFMGAHLIESYRAVCRSWPYARLPRSHWTPVESDVPTLLLSGGRDPVTPPESAEAVAAHLSRRVHVVVPNGGHGVGGDCILRMMSRLIATGSVEGLDTSCVAAAAPTRFVRRGRSPAQMPPG